MYRLRKQLERYITCKNCIRTVCLTVSTVDSLFCRLLDGDVEEGVDFVRFMIGWQLAKVQVNFADAL